MESDNTTQQQQDPVRPEIVDGVPGDDSEGAVERQAPSVTEPSKLIRIASMTRAMLDEVKEAPLDDAGTTRLVSIYERSIEELKDVLSEDLREELDAVFIPMSDDTPSEAELRIAQAQLVGWLEGLFHGIQASLISQQMAASAQLERMRERKAIEGSRQPTEGNGLYL